MARLGHDHSNIGTVDIDSTGADLIIVNVHYWAGPVSVSDDGSNTWMPGTERGGGYANVRQFYAWSPNTSGSQTITVSGGISTTFDVVWYDDIDSSGGDPFDVQNGASALTAALTTTVANALVNTSASAYYLQTTPYTIASPFTAYETYDDATNVPALSADYSQTSAGSVTATWSTGGSPISTAVSLMSFRRNGGGAAFKARSGLFIRQAVNRAGTY